ncbi:DUF4303 domain-containing protein [Roseateles sp. NT4]|uniref:DUF4303 domain-containing protein n=1 Tax=Roseateles sp. NT4 TaxID=3453715 RepID=UPI003EEAE8E6
MAEHPSQPTQQALVQALAAATRRAVEQLFTEHPETFYYLTLVTTGEALPPTLAAWSSEALSAKAGAPGEVDLLKWSYADSPYCGYGQHCFLEVIRLFELRPRMTHEMAWAAWEAEHQLRLDAMEMAMKQLDEEGLFGRGDERDGILIAVEVMPPDPTNAGRVRRLNPAGSPVLQAWMEEAAEA